MAKHDPIIDTVLRHTGFPDFPASPDELPDNSAWMVRSIAEIVTIRTAFGIVGLADDDLAANARADRATFNRMLEAFQMLSSRYANGADLLNSAKTKIQLAIDTVAGEA